jgi:hypothetical protein
MTKRTPLFRLGALASLALFVIACSADQGVPTNAAAAQAAPRHADRRAASARAAAASLPSPTRAPRALPAAGRPFVPVAVEGSAVPQERSLGGPVLPTPVIVPITWDTDPDRGAVEAYAAAIGGTDYWSAVASEYGVGAITMGDTVHLTTAPPSSITSAAIESMLIDKLDSGADGWPAPAPGSIYSFFFPTETRVTADDGSVACEGTFGWHAEATLASGRQVAYAVMPKCVTDSITGATGFDVIASTASHEWIEASTDPFPNAHTAFATLDRNHLAFVSFFGANSEVADLCAWSADQNAKVAGLDFVAQRSWSNAAARAGHDPCVPAPDAPYFTARAVLDDIVPIPDVNGNATETQGISLAVGESRTVDVVLASDGPTDVFDVSAIDRREFQSGTAELSFTFDATSGVSGDTLRMTIKRIAPGTGGGTAFAVMAKLGGRQTLSAAYVADPDASAAPKPATRSR